MSDTQNVGNIRFVSWNVRGIHNPVKRSRVFAHLKSLGSDIIFLQETHLRTTDHGKLKKTWIGQTFSSKSEYRTRGAAILVRRGISFIPLSTISDTRGRYVIVAGELYGARVVLANVYGPNWDDPSFFLIS